MKDSGDGLEGLLESPPNIIVLGSLSNHLEAFKDVNDVVDTSSLNFELVGNLVQFEGDFLPPLEVLDELSAEFLQALFLAIV